MLNENHILVEADRICSGITKNTAAKITLAPGRAITEYAEISCEKMIVATHFPILNKHGAYILPKINLSVLLPGVIVSAAALPRRGCVQ